MQVYWYFILCYIILSQLIMRLWSEFDKWSKIEILLSKHTSTYLFDPIIIHHLGTRRPAKLLHDGNRPLLKLYFKLYIFGISYDNLWTFKSWHLVCFLACGRQIIKRCGGYIDYYTRSSLFLVVPDFKEQATPCAIPNCGSQSNHHTVLWFACRMPESKPNGQDLTIIWNRRNIKRQRENQIDVTLI